MDQKLSREISEGIPQGFQWGIDQEPSRPNADWFWNDLLMVSNGELTRRSPYKFSIDFDWNSFRFVLGHWPGALQTNCLLILKRNSLRYPMGNCPRTYQTNWYWFWKEFSKGSNRKSTRRSPNKFPICFERSSSRAPMEHGPGVLQTNFILTLKRSPWSFKLEIDQEQSTQVAYWFWKGIS